MYDFLGRLWARIDVKGDDDCWLWTGGRRNGYGSLRSRRRHHTVSRVVWEITARRPIPEGLCVRHACDNPPCVNPAHLLLGTHGDNVRDAVARGRHGSTRKTHCPQGHPYDEANTLRSRRNVRLCLTCERARWKRVNAARREGRPPLGERTHCGRGHEFTEANTYWPPNGRARHCRQCNAERERERNRRRRLATYDVSPQDALQIANQHEIQVQLKW